MDRLGAKIAATIAACVQAGCYWPVPSCEPAVATLPVTVRRFTPGAGEGFVADGTSYASCRDFCARQPNVTQVRACTAPDPHHVAGVAGVAYWQVACDVDTMVCEQPTIATMGSGRPFEGFRRARVPASAGTWLAEMARLETASVFAFERLARELAAHRAPHDLVVAARRAAQEAVRHARIARALARRWGHRPEPVRRMPLPIRGLASMAEENAIEGCVGETVGAVVAAYQALHATDPRVRAAMGTIARDEAAHAVLAWRVHAWARERLGARRRAALARTLSRALDNVCIPHGLRELGLPSHTTTDRLRREVRTRLGAETLTD